MTIEVHKAIIHRVITEIVNQKNLDVADEIISPNLTISLGTNVLQGPEAYKQLIQWLHATIADVEYTIEEMIAEGDKVVIRTTAQGTHHGMYAGIPGTGKPVTYSEVFVYRLEDGKIAELWGCVNQLNILKQVGAQILPPK